MSTFYGSLQGDRNMVTRRGSTSSGIHVSAQSWKGSVITDMYYSDNNELMVRISTAEGSSSYGSTIFTGTFEEFVTRLKKEGC